MGPSDHIIRRCPTSTEIMEFLLHIPYDYLDADRLIKATLSVSIGRREVERLEESAMLAWDAAGSPARGTLNDKQKGK